jgi:polysaccharide biosynthesis protein PslH
MRILYIVPYVPNLVRVRPYNLIRNLSQGANQVTVVTLYTTPEEYHEVEGLRQLGCQVTSRAIKKSESWWNCLHALPGKTPLQAAYSWHPEMAKTLEEMLVNQEAAFDIVHVEHLRGVKYALHLKSFLNLINQKTPIIWDSVDCISLLFRQATEKRPNRLKRWLTFFELNRTERYEGWLVDQFDSTLVTSEIDRQALISLSKNEITANKISVLANGVDLDFFKPNPDVIPEPDTLIVSGKMSYHANLAMVLYLTNEIMPLIWKSKPEMKLTIAGKDPPREINNLANDARIQITGTVADLRPYLWRSSIAVAPLIYGVGIQNKILEAMACGLPVITSPQGISALNVTPGKEVLVASDALHFASEVLRLSGNAQERKYLSQHGYNYVKMNHSWILISSQLEEIYRKELGKTKVF